MDEPSKTDVWLRLVTVAIDGRPVTAGAALLVLRPSAAPFPAWSLLLVGVQGIADQPGGISMVQARTASGRLFCGGMRLTSRSVGCSVARLEGIDRPRRLDGVSIGHGPRKTL